MDNTMPPLVDDEIVLDDEDDVDYYTNEEPDNGISSVYNSLHINHGLVTRLLDLTESINNIRNNLSAGILDNNRATPREIFGNSHATEANSFRSLFDVLSNEPAPSNAPRDCSDDCNGASKDKTFYIEDFIDANWNNPIARAMYRDSACNERVDGRERTETKVLITPNDIFDDDGGLKIKEHGHLHRYNYKCKCSLCTNITTRCISTIILGEQPPRLHYLDAAFEEIFRWNTYTHDNEPWYCDRDEIMDAMLAYYPGYGCSVCVICENMCLVYIHRYPSFLVMQFNDLPKKQQELFIADMWADRNRINANLDLYYSNDSNDNSDRSVLDSHHTSGNYAIGNYGSISSQLISAHTNYITGSMQSID